MIPSFKAIALAVISTGVAASLHAQTQLTVDFSGYQFTDGGSLNGTFTVSLVGGVPTSLLSADVVSGPGSLLSGSSYLFGTGASDNLVNYGIDGTEAGGDPANEVFLVTANDNIWLDWNGSSDTSTLYVGDPAGEHTAESDLNSGFNRGLEGIPTPEPGTLTLVGIGGLGLMRFRRRK